MSDLTAILALSFLGSVAGLVGGVLFIVKDSWARVLCKYAVPFASGVLMSVSLLHLLPEASHALGDKAFIVALIALLSSFFFEQYFARLHHHDQKDLNKAKGTVSLVIFGDTIHNFIDGVAIAAAYLTDPVFGVVVALAAFLHETPHEIGDFGILMSSGWSKGKTFMANLFSALATFPGAIWVYLTFSGGDAHMRIGFFLAVSAGVFLYLGVGDFLPEVGREKDGVSTWKKFALLVSGVTVMYLLSLVSPH